MSFDVVHTPTLHVVTTEDEKLLAGDLQQRVAEAITQAEAQPEVVEASEARRITEERLERLQKAERFLSRFAKESRERLANASEAALDAIVESAVSGSKPGAKNLDELAAIENQNRYTSRAIQRIVEHLIPVAKIARLREESHALMTQARALERIAQERAEKVLTQLRSAVTEEVVLPVDMSKGVAGALLAHAGSLKHHAVQISENAEQLERTHSEQRRGAGD